jgi:hypothetical protein
MQDYHQLEIWNRAMDYVVAIYEFVGGLRGVMPRRYEF